MRLFAQDVVLTLAPVAGLSIGAYVADPSLISDFFPFIVIVGLVIGLVSAAIARHLRGLP